MRIAALVGAVVLATGQTALADEVEESLQLALEAYQAGDIASSRDELAFVMQVLLRMQAASFARLLPDAPPGWTKSDEDGESAMQGLGGMMAKATYSNGNSRMDVQFVADNQMVTSMATMFGNTAMLSTMGEVRRINRQTVVVDRKGELKAVVDKRILVQISGSAPAEDKEMLFGAIDLRALSEF